MPLESDRLLENLAYTQDAYAISVVFQGASLWLRVLLSPLLMFATYLSSIGWLLRC
jgi:hypothetical protein